MAQASGRQTGGEASPVIGRIRRDAETGSRDCPLRERCDAASQARHRLTAQRSQQPTSHPIGRAEAVGATVCSLGGEPVAASLWLSESRRACEG